MMIFFIFLFTCNDVWNLLTVQYEQSAFVSGQQYDTTLLYTVEVEPKMWLPVQLVEGRISREIQMNLFSIREEARRISDSISSS